ncbi:MAG TPA: trypsin-like peptidase domain-containing protein [Actinomycetota bacterium]|nr:trypsin-like peptidase domain-containing protein [Actinomycetota bacterium]
MRLRVWLIIVAVLLGGCSLRVSDTSEAGNAPDVALPSASGPAIHSEISSVVQRVLPSVVNIRVTSVSQDLFGAPVEQQGQGSGVVIDENGTILTNNHVVRGAVEVRVVFNDGRDLEGEVVGTAVEQDLAVVRVDTDDLRPIEIGRSADLRLGDDVLAVGFPLGLGGPTVTRGIVSGKERTVTAGDGSGFSEKLEGLLQTDAAINPGNSGGALVDALGRLVGINTAGVQAGQAENIGFAIPIDKAIPIVEEILSEPQTERAWLGVQVVTLDDVTAAQLGLDPDLEGALVAGVFESSPAAEAGIEQGDVIVRVGDTEVRGGDDLTRALTNLDPGDEVEVDLVSDGGTRTVEVVLAQRPVTLG